MEQAVSAMYSKGIYIILLTLVLLSGFMISIFFPGKSVKQQNKSAIFTVAFALAILAFTVIVSVPFAKDFFRNNIVTTKGIYTNVLGNQKKSSSAIAGIYSVTLNTGEEELKLTTAPWCNDVFVVGQYNVVAYYLPESKTLLHIEIRGQGDGSAVRQGTVLCLENAQR